ERRADRRGRARIDPLVGGAHPRMNDDARPSTQRIDHLSNGEGRIEAGYLDESVSDRMPDLAGGHGRATSADGDDWPGNARRRKLRRSADQTCLAPELRQG